MWIRQIGALALLFGSVVSSLEMPSLSSLSLDSASSTISAPGERVTTEQSTQSLSSKPITDSQTTSVLSQPQQPTSQSSTSSHSRTRLASSTKHSMQSSAPTIASTNTMISIGSQSSNSTLYPPTTQIQTSVSATYPPFSLNQNISSSATVPTTIDGPSNYPLLQPTRTSANLSNSTSSSKSAPNRNSNEPSTSPPRGAVVALIIFGILAGGIIVIYCLNRMRARQRDEARMSAGVGPNLGAGEDKRGYSEIERGNVPGFMGSRVSRSRRGHEGHLSISQPFAPGNQAGRGAFNQSAGISRGPSIIISAPSLPKVNNKPAWTSSGDERSPTFLPFSQGKSLADQRGVSDGSAYSENAYAGYTGDEEDGKYDWSDERVY